ncbi:two-component system response regulator YesN [Paenibacillus castaneae]|uniref:response regulator n=1 Tax=Paenibacillus castaneae TaxID=474957 RepID=UPI000C9B4E5A|nr:response regulator [Paenibacillus castaneae]NIK75112.1 two-component system response regulator YesN [Paenibacillus castaneae]
MFKVMIVDDEIVVRKGIMTSIDWAAHGIEITADARNGKDALYKLQQEPVDLIVTDIRMPFMSGIELARSVKMLYPNIGMILLSGYEDFQYAKEAMLIGIQHYLLKPVIADKLISTIMEVMDSEHKKRIMRQADLIKSKLFNENLPFIKSKFMNSLINKRLDKSEMMEKANSLRISLEGPMYQIIVMEIDDYTIFKECLSQKENEAYLFALLNVAEETLVSRYRGFVGFGESGKLIILINIEADTSIMSLCEDIQSKLMHYLKVSVSIGIGQPVHYIMNASQSYDQAVQAIQEKAFFGKGKIIVYLEQNGTRSPDSKRLVFFRDEEKKLVQSLLTFNIEGLRETIDHYFMRFKSESISFEGIKSYCVRIMICLIQTLKEMDIDSERVFPAHFLPQIAVEKYELVADLEIWINEYMEQVIDLIGERTKHHSKKIVKEVIHYVRNHYDKPIGLTEAADYIAVTPPHLSKVFKEEMGITFIKWLNQLRMEEAKRLLKHTFLKTYEIAEKVGFQDYKYFSLIFKKHTGYSPRDYRNK